MKCVLLIYDNADTREVVDEGLMAEVDALLEELTESGELAGGEALADPSNTRTVRVRDGSRRSRTARWRRQMCTSAGI
jgi:hypothetical protein